jgi:hypothetical protein
MLHLVAGLVFFLLSPGVLLTIPAGSRGLFASGQTSVVAAAVHATLFVVVAYLLTGVVEGFDLGYIGTNQWNRNLTANLDALAQGAARAAAEAAAYKPAVTAYDCDTRMGIRVRAPGCFACINKNGGDYKMCAGNACPQC